MGKVFTKATNFLEYCTGSADGIDSALGAGASGVNCVACISKVCNGSG